MDERIKDTIQPLVVLQDELQDEVGELEVQIQEKRDSIKRIDKMIKLAGDSESAPKKKERVRKISPHLVDRVYDALAKSNEPMTRAELKEATGSAIETVGAAIATLREQGKVRHAGSRGTGNAYRNPEIFAVMDGNA
jgi:DNA-binding transcriptional regulator GbsR (MarR family)